MAPLVVDQEQRRKHLLRVGSWSHPHDKSRKLRVTLDTLKALKRGFDSGIRDRVPLQADHGSDWRSAVGNVVALDLDDDGLYATIEAEEETSKAIASGRVTGVSAAFAEDHLDTESGVRVGPTLLHVALTNRPYVRRLQSFTPVHLSDGTVIVELIEEVLVPTTRARRARGVHRGGGDGDRGPQGAT